MNHSIYQNIATRTAGDIYIGVVGPVRTGKSTFIKRFMETQVIPNIENVYRRERARDELPQSGSGRTIMTAEPKFVPEEAAQIELEGGATLLAERRTEVRCETDLPDGYQVTARAEVAEEPRGSVSERGVDARFALDFRIEAARTAKALCVTSAELDADAPKDALDAPSLVLRRMAPDESAWDMAKAHSSTVAAILDANCLTDEAELSRDALILIPRKRG